MTNVGQGFNPRIVTGFMQMSHWPVTIGNHPSIRFPSGSPSHRAGSSETGRERSGRFQNWPLGVPPSGFGLLRRFVWPVAEHLQASRPVKAPAITAEWIMKSIISKKS
jgi:hypothetical protein